MKMMKNKVLGFVLLGFFFRPKYIWQNCGAKTPCHPGTVSPLYSKERDLGWLAFDEKKKKNSNVMPSEEISASKLIYPILIPVSHC